MTTLASDADKIIAVRALCNEWAFLAVTTDQDGNPQRLRDAAKVRGDYAALILNIIGEA